MTSADVTSTLELPIDPATAAAIDRLPGIGLDQLVERAALTTRHDRKYLFPPRLLPTLLATIDAPLRVLDIDGRRTFPYRSTYFDTPDLLSYHDAARSRPRRFKVRTRSYLSTDTCWVEVKSRNGRGTTAKDRIEVPPTADTALTADAARFVARHPAVTVGVADLTPALVTGYQRLTIHCGQRATIDGALWCSTPDGDHVDLGELPRLLIVETKSAGPTPGPVDRALWQLGIRPSVVSKYAVGTAAAHPDLSANRWSRVLHRHVRPTSPGEP